MKFKITAKVFFDSGEVKKFDWIETDPARRGQIKEGDATKDIKIPIESVEEAERIFAAMFRNFQKTGDVFVVKNIMGEMSGVPFSKVSYWTLKVEEVTGDVKDVVQPAPDTEATDVSEPVREVVRDPFNPNAKRVSVNGKKDMKVKVTGGQEG